MSPKSFGLFLDNPMANWGVVLGGGGLTGLLHVAILEWLHAHRIPVGAISSSGTGSVVGCLYAQGWEPAAIRDWIGDFIALYAKPPSDWYTFWTFFVHWSGKFRMGHALWKPGPFQARYQSAFGGLRLEDLPIPCTVMTTDIRTGKSVALRQGPVASAVYASSATLPFLPPIAWADQWLADGTFTEPFPILPLSDHGVRVILVPYIEEPWTERGHIRGGSPLVRQYASFLSRAVDKAHRNRTPLFLDLHHDEIVFVKIRLDKPVVPEWGSVAAALDTIRQAWERQIWNVLPPEVLSSVQRPR